MAAAPLRHKSVLREIMKNGRFENREKHANSTSDRQDHTRAAGQIPKPRGYKM
jgi:hypothetical protein